MGRKSETEGWVGGELRDGIGSTFYWIVNINVGCSGGRRSGGGDRVILLLLADPAASSVPAIVECEGKSIW